jgi:L-alanine-DL-glutamate epimerase-like enolase superfamily enzyme
VKITDVVAYAVKYPAEYIFTRPADPRTRESDYFVRPGFPTVYSSHNEALLVRVETDGGLVGWGEALAPVVPESVAIVVARLIRPLLLGADPCDVEPLWNRLYDAMRVRGHLTGLYVDAIAAVDVALWDLLGQVARLPIARLLGGVHRDRVAVYWSGVAGTTPDEVAANAGQHARDGFRAVKLQLGHGRDDLATFAAVREAVGPGVGVALDAHWHYSVAEALAVGRQLERLGALFFEAPIVPEDVDGHAQLAAALDVPIAIGEGERTRWQFLRLLQARAVDVAQPDLGRTGLTEGRRIATLCEAFNVPVAPHVSTGLGVRFAATLHYAAAISGFLMLEYQGKLLDAINASLVEPIRVEASQIAVPTGPGLGVRVNEAALAPHWRMIE